METSLDGSDYYRETWYTGSGTVVLYMKSYRIGTAPLGGPGEDGALSISIPNVIGSWARFTYTSTTTSATNFAVDALAGRE